MNEDIHGSVLVVDDNPEVLESTSLMLREYGYSVDTSLSADEAINKLKENNIDVVVTDIVMPYIQGTELLKIVHDIAPQIPVILMTAYADMEKVIEAIKIGAFDFMIKPFQPELLIHSVAKAVNYIKLVQKEKDYKNILEEFNQEIETLVAERTVSLMALTMADKIRNPATVIGLICKRVLETEEVPNGLKGKFREINDESEKLANLVSSFHSILQSKRSMFVYEDINMVVGNIIPIIKSKATDRGVELVYNPHENPLKANIQKKLFQIAFFHLIKNSIEATPKGGKITVSSSEAENDILLTITDTGQGISSEDIKRIFDPIFSTKDQRFGMGLPLVKRIITEHMGKIDVESRPGEGTVFSIILPRRWTVDQRSELQP